MNINKLNDLTVGMTFKNYKELVAFFDEEVKGGKGKTYQLENFKRYFDYEKQGNKFVITAIKDAPTEKKLRGKTATVGKELDVLLANALLMKEMENSNSNSDTKDCYTYKQLYTKVLDIVKLDGNEIFFECTQPHDLADHFGLVDGEFVANYKEKLIYTLKDDFKRSLNRLQKNDVITIEDLALYVSKDEPTPKMLRASEYEDFLELEKQVSHELDIKLNQRYRNASTRFKFDEKFNGYLGEYLSLDEEVLVDSSWKAMKLTRLDCNIYETLDAKSFNALLEQYTIELTKRIYNSCVNSAFKGMVVIADDFKETTIKNIELYCNKINEQLFTHIETSVLEVAV